MTRRCIGYRCATALLETEQPCGADGGFAGAHDHLPAKNITTMEGTKSLHGGGHLGSSATYQWQRWNGAVWANIWGAAAASYTLTVWSTDDNAFFRAMVSNAAGSTFSSIAYLTVQYLHIVAPPQSQLVAAGTRATFWWE